jgi:outer membrane protein TolC
VRRTLRAGFALLVVALPGVARAQDPLTLEQALERAGRQNPEVLAANERVAAMQARSESVRQVARPRVFLQSGWSYSDNPATVFMGKLNSGQFTQQDFAIDNLNSPDALGHLSTALSVEMPVDLAGKVRDRADGLSAQQRAIAESTREAVQELRLRVVEAYRRADLARRAVAVTERALEVARAREAQIEARVQEGAALQADLLRARTRRRQHEADLAERRGDVAIATAGLTRLLGDPAGTIYELTGPPRIPAPLEGDEPAWTARARQQRPSLAAARDRAQGASLLTRSEQRTAWPDLGVFAQVQDDRTAWSKDAQSGTLGVMLRWNIFDATRGKRVAAAAAEQRAADLDSRAASDQVRLDVETAFRRALATRDRLQAAAGGAEDGREALRVVQERRAAGMATLTDELETETAALGAELQELRAAAELAIADAALRRAAGEL